MFSQVDISLNGTLISSSTNRAMLETLLFYGHDAKTLQLTCQMYYKDTPAWMDSIIVTAADGNRPNEGLQSRYNARHRRLPV